MCRHYFFEQIIRYEDEKAEIEKPLIYPFTVRKEK